MIQTASSELLQMIPLSEHLRLMQEKDQKHLRILQGKDQKIHLLEKRIRFREELDAVPAEVMSQNQKAALYTAVKAIETTKPDEKGRVLLKGTDDIAKSVGMSVKRLQKHWSYCDEIGVLQKETLPVRDDNGQILYTETYVEPTARTFYPRQYEAEKARNHGGDRLTCRCGSERIKKEVRYICMDCGEVHIKPPKFNPPVEPDEPEDQFGSTVNSEQETESPDSEATIVESYLVPEDQFGSTAESDLKPNLTRSSNNYPQDQLDPTVDSLEDDSTNHPPSVSTPIDHDSIIEEWLRKRLGTPDYVFATGSLEHKKKYKWQFALDEKGEPIVIGKDKQGKPIYEHDENPNITAFIAGKVGHIYGSKLIQNGKTWVLCFEIDSAEHDEQIDDILCTLARAGIAAVYWQRYANGRQRGHLEIYLDAPIYPERARLWLCEICPDLADIPEIYPCQDKASNALSWPLYQQIGSQVYPCKAKYMLPAPHAGGLQECDPTDKEALARLITVAVTPAAFVEEYSAAADDLAQQKREQGQDNGQGVVIGIQPKPRAKVGDTDLVPQVLDSFDAQYNWDDFAAMCGGWDNGHFRAVWRMGNLEDETASVAPDRRNDRYAHDYGIVGMYRAHFDKFQAWCYIHGLDRTEELNRRCAELRRQQNS